MRQPEPQAITDFLGAVEGALLDGLRDRDQILQLARQYQLAKDLTLEVRFPTRADLLSPGKGTQIPAKGTTTDFVKHV
jgi:hypothetical protein